MKFSAYSKARNGLSNSGQNGNSTRLEQQWAERQQHQARTDKTKEVLLAAKDRRIKALEAENRQLKEELKITRGKLYEQV
ncbi:hypothetical protein ccbrp13_41890 [Ktedonobacteria bacterium brp13]|nr:hypothetical protein ccbrp13_41890 [Ktedonobacteria bacterium brp13]